MQVGTSDTDLRLVAIRELLVNAGCYVMVVNLFDCCHCKHGEWGCTNARRDFWRTHSVEKRKVIELQITSLKHIVKSHFPFKVPEPINGLKKMNKWRHAVF